jgi:hypothetical protein
MTLSTQTRGATPIATPSALPCSIRDQQDRAPGARRPACGSDDERLPLACRPFHVRV